MRRFVLAASLLCATCGCGAEERASRTRVVPVAKSGRASVAAEKDALTKPPRAIATH
jgi:hypothetical protein